MNHFLAQLNSTQSWCLSNHVLSKSSTSRTLRGQRQCRRQGVGLTRTGLPVLPIFLPLPFYYRNVLFASTSQQDANRLPLAALLSSLKAAVAAACMHGPNPRGYFLHCAGLHQGSSQTVAVADFFSRSLQYTASIL